MDEQQLIELCKAGDRHALGWLYTLYAPKMKKLCCRYVRDESVAEDIVHDSFIIAYSHISQLDDAAKVEHWMARIVINLSLYHLRRNEKAQRFSLDEIKEGEELITHSATADIDYEELVRLVDTLPAGYKSVFKLSVLEGRSHREIGKMLGINPHSSSSQLARAKEMLRTLAKKYGYVPVVILFFLYALQTHEPTRQIERYAARNTGSEPTKRKKTGRSIAKAERKEPAERSSCEDAGHELQTDTLAAHNADSISVQRADTATQERIILPKLPEVYVTANHIAPQHEEKKEASWLVSVSYSGGAEANGTIFTQRPGAGSDTDGDDSPTEGDEKIEGKSHHDMPFVISFSLHKDLGRRWGIGTGIRYTRLRSTFTPISGEGTPRRQTVEYVGIPVNATYHVGRLGNLSFYASAGFAADIPVRGSHTLQWSLSAGAGLQYRLAPNWSIFAEPGINWHLNSSQGTPTMWTERPYDFTIPFGLRFSW